MTKGIIGIFIAMILSVSFLGCGHDSGENIEKLVYRETDIIDDETLFKDVKKIVLSVNEFRLNTPTHFLSTYELNPDFGFGYTPDLNVLSVSVIDTKRTDRSVYSEIDILMYLFIYVSNHSFEREIDGIEYRFTQSTMIASHEIPMQKYMSCEEFSEMCKNVEFDENEPLDNKVKKLSEYYISSTGYQRAPGFTDVDGNLLLHSDKEQ